MLHISAYTTIMAKNVRARGRGGKRFLLVKYLMKDRKVRDNHLHPGKISVVMLRLRPQGAVESWEDYRE